MPSPKPDITYTPDFLDDEEQRDAMRRILATSPLQTHEVVVFGKRHETPRRTAWHADPGCSYRYSGLTHEPAPWTPVLADLRERLESRLGVLLNSVLVNHYRSGADAVGWHADDEAVFGQRPTIASVSLGHPRRFVLKLRNATGEAAKIRHEWRLEPGSLLVMRGDTQEKWLHCVPRTRRDVGERVNLTWRPYVGVDE